MSVDFQEERFLIPIAAGHRSDNFDIVVDAFNNTGEHRVTKVHQVTSSDAPYAAQTLPPTDHQDTTTVTATAPVKALPAMPDAPRKTAASTS